MDRLELGSEEALGTEAPRAAVGLMTHPRTGASRPSEDGYPKESLVWLTIPNFAYLGMFSGLFSDLWEVLGVTRGSGRGEAGARDLIEEEMF